MGGRNHENVFGHNSRPPVSGLGRPSHKTRKQKRPGACPIFFVLVAGAGVSRGY